MRNSTSYLNSELENIEFFKKFPNLTPFIGENYLNPNHKKLLVIGESHYLPIESSIHLDPENWYQSDQSSLNQEEASWIFTSNLVKFLCTKMFRKINKTLDEAGINSTSSNLIEEVAYYNYFQRPAIEKQSIKDSVTDLDQQMAFKVFKAIVKIIKPDLIIFMSKFSVDSAEIFKAWEYTNQYNSLYTYTNHPMSAHWNTAVRKSFFEGRTSRDHFSYFLEKNDFFLKGSS